jgi:hypothetical protein
MLVLPAGRIRFGSMHAVRAAGRGASPGSRVDAEDARAMEDGMSHRMNAIVVPRRPPFPCSSAPLGGEAKRPRLLCFAECWTPFPQSECLTPPDASRASIEASGSATSSKLIGHTFRNQRLASSRSSCSRPPSLRAKLCSSSAVRAAVGQSWLTALQRAPTSARSVTKSASRADAVTTWKTRA